MPNRARRRVDDPPHIDMAPVREENRDIWARAQSVYDHFKLAWLFWVAFAGLLTWAMMNIIQPLQAVPKLQAQSTGIERKIDSVIVPRLDHADQDRRDIAQVLKVFGKILCAQTTPADRYKYDINCRRDVPAPDPIPPGGP
jgi:hypothetical protein